MYWWKMLLKLFDSSWIGKKLKPKEEKYEWIHERISMIYVARFP